MQNVLNWQAENGVITLSGDLDRETLLPFWKVRQQVIGADITTIDVSALSRVDSAGLAMLVHLLDEGESRKQPLKLTGMTEKLQMLASLYNLQQIIQPYLVSTPTMV